MFRTLQKVVLSTNRFLFTKIPRYSKSIKQSNNNQQSSERIFILPKSVAARHKNREQSSTSSSPNSSASQQAQQAQPNYYDQKPEKQPSYFQDSTKDEDVHSRRFVENLKLESGG
jgi:hypothetical protein